MSDVMRGTGGKVLKVSAKLTCVERFVEALDNGTTSSCPQVLKLRFFSAVHRPERIKTLASRMRPQYGRVSW